MSKWARLVQSHITDMKEMVGTQGILLLGKGANTPIEAFDTLRDIDFLVIHHNDQFFERSVFEVEGIVFDQSFISINDLKQVIQDQNEMWLGILNHSKVVWLEDSFKSDLEAMIDKVKDLNKMGPSPLNEWMCQWIRYQMGAYLEEIALKKNSDSFFVEEALWRYFRFVVTQAYAIHGKWLPKEKRQLEGLKDINYDLYKALIEWIESDLLGKLEKSKMISKILLKDVGEPIFDYPRGRYPLLK